MSLQETANDFLGSTGAVALGVAIVTYVLPEAIRYFMRGRGNQLSDSTKIRVELWSQLAELRKELAVAHTTLDEWKAKYYKLQEQLNEAIRREKQALDDLDEYKTELEKTRLLMEAKERKTNDALSDERQSKL